MKSLIEVMVVVVLPITFLWALFGVWCRPGNLSALFKLVLGAGMTAVLTQQGVADDARLIFLPLAVSTSLLGAADIVAMKTAALVKGQSESLDSIIEHHNVS